MTGISGNYLTFKVGNYIWLLLEERSLNRLPPNTCQVGFLLLP
ncbi:MAG: hypothetical protein O4808_18880 [Trichodesmium sp. St17_bin3_1_1]|nr:hypothetical protein [Trichodesmium sp. St17_bin3_1_1]